VTRTPLAIAALALLLTGCPREDRTFHPAPPFSDRVRFEEEYQQNAYALSEGKRLFQAMNCSGCHGSGGGGIGPPLMDADWLYGAEPAQVFETIHGGRPNGMPAFGGKLPDHQIWQLAAYVRSLSGQAGSDAAPSRADHMQAAPAETERDREPPRMAPAPDAREMPK
jgi:cytochrome c oxidase cbb3-type subunit 3